MLLELKFPAGVYRNGTDYQAKGRWTDANLVRWTEGTLRPVGGWLKMRGNLPRIDLAVTGKARGAHAWLSNAARRFAAFGTHSGLFALTFDGTKNLLRDITPTGLAAGFADTQANFGYGGGTYGFEAYGTPRTEIEIVNRATTWSMDNYGQELLAVHEQDGRLMRWDLTASVASPVVATAGTVPTGNRGVVVTDERFVFLLQAGGNPRRIAWCDQENIFNWQITATTQAGDFELQTTGRILKAIKTRGETVILTTEDAHKAAYIGAPLVYGFERVGTGCGVISPNAAVAVDNSVLWMGERGFFSYSGTVSPIPCEVSDYVFSRLNAYQAQKVWCDYNAQFGEVTWYYPSGTEVDSYVTYNVREGHWSIGSMARTIGLNDAIFPNPIRVSPDGLLYQHEIGHLYDSAMPYAQSGPIELGQGPVVYLGKYLWPDDKTQGDVRALFTVKPYPNSPALTAGPYTLASPTSVRFTGRQAALRIEGVASTDWRVGVPRLEVEPGGLR